MSIQPNNRFLIAMIPLLLLGVMIFSSCFGGCKKAETMPLTSTPTTASEVTVYFTKSRGTNTVTEGVVRPLPQNAPSKLQYAIEALLKGPTDTESMEGFYSEIPKGTRLLGVKEENGKLVVDLSKQFTSGGGSNSVKQRMAELQQTIVSVAKNQPVFVTVEGQKIDTVGGEGLEVDQPVTANPR